MTPENTIKFVMVTDLSVGRNSAEVLRVLDALQAGGLMPCDWQPGQPSSSSKAFHLRLPLPAACVPIGSPLLAPRRAFFFGPAVWYLCEGMGFDLDFPRHRRHPDALQRH